MKKHRRGFTLIELIIVIIIVGILAAVSVPMMQNNITRAKRTEALMGMGMLRTAQRAYFVEFGNYVAIPYNAVDTTPGINRYISAADLNGTYYDSSCYAVTAFPSWLRGVRSTIYARNPNNSYEVITMDLINGNVSGM